MQKQTAEERGYYALNQRVYSLSAPLYDLIVFPIRKLRRQVAAIAAPTPRSRVLDVATGTGAQARAFAERAGEVIGIDLAEPMLRRARRKNPFPNLSFQRADATDLPFPDASFDISCVSFALHEMPGPIRKRAIAEIARVTRPGGKVVIVDYGRRFAKEGRLFRLVALIERKPFVDFVRSDLAALLGENGIRARQDHPFLGKSLRVVVGIREPVPESAASR